MSTDDYDADLEKACKAIEALESVIDTNQLENLYSGTARDGVVGGPYEWQAEFHDKGAQYSHRALICANRVGKTRTVGAEVAIHATGLYPDWWRGKRFTQRNDWCVCGVTNQDIRDVQQGSLFGNIISEGKGRAPDGMGWVPKTKIKKASFRVCGVPDVLDTVTVQHVTGGFSRVFFRSYEQGALKFQGFEVDGMWFDEEPDDDRIYPEAITRLISRRGIFLLSRTPLFGASELISTFTQDETDTTWFTTATWEDAPHLDEKSRKELIALYPEHQRDTRTKGIVMLGSGGVYPVADKDLMVDEFPIPDWYRRIVGIDFGIDHPAAAVWTVHDPESDVIYVTDCYKKSGETPVYHAAAIRERGDWIPVAWPHDGMVRDKGGGQMLKTQYEHSGANMLAISARYEDDKAGGQPTEPVVNEILERMRTGRFKVFRNLRDWFLEKSGYHRKDGQIVKKRDDIMAATNYAVMMNRYATSKTESRTIRPQVVSGLDYDPLQEFSRSA